MVSHKIRMAKTCKLLVLGCPVAGLQGKIALGTYSCTKWHIAVRTDGFQHPACIQFLLTNGRTYKNYPRTDTRKYSKCYIVNGYEGEFDVCVRWRRGHSPYPGIKDMGIWCFGIPLGDMEFPKEPDDYKTVAHVVIARDGRVTVNGINTGVWEEFIPG